MYAYAVGGRVGRVVLVAVTIGSPSVAVPVGRSQDALEFING